MYCNAFSTTFTAVHCFQLRKKVLRLDATSYQISDRTMKHCVSCLIYYMKHCVSCLIYYVQHVCLWLQNEHKWQFYEEFTPHPWGMNDNDAHACEQNYITVQNKIIPKIVPLNKFKTLKFSFNEWVVFSWLLCFALQYMFIQIGSQTWASLSFVPPGWGANSSQSCRSCSFSGHKQRCWTVLSELRYKVAYNPNTFFLNWKQRSAEKAVEDALQYNKMYVAGVWTKTAKRYFKNVEEQVIRRQSKVWSNL